MGKLELQAVSKEFKTGKVLDRISLAVEDGEIVVVFGPSGSGKTLLLRLVAGVEQPDEGRILLGGRDVTDSPPEARGVGMAFQNFALFPHMSAFDNVASALTARKALPSRTHEVSPMTRGYPAGNRRRHLRHQVGRVFACWRTGRGCGPAQRSSNAWRRAGRAGHVAHPGRLRGDIAGTGRAYSEPRPPRCGCRCDGPGRWLMAD